MKTTEAMKTTDERVNNTTNGLLKSALSVERSSSNLWNKTGQLIVLNNDVYSDPEISKKTMAKFFTSEMSLNCDGDFIFWSTWIVTSRIMHYTSDIFKGIELLGYDKVFPLVDGTDGTDGARGKLVPRSKLLKMIGDSKPTTSEHQLEAGDYTSELPVETVIRCIDLVLAKIPDLNAEDKDAIQGRLAELSNAFSD